MLEILTIAYFAGIVLAIAGGIIFAQWPKPSLVRFVRSTGMAFCAASFLLTSPFALYVHLQSPQLATWFWLSVGVIPSVVLWFIFAYMTDRFTGCHAFGGEEAVFIVEHDEPRHTKGRHLNTLV